MPRRSENTKKPNVETANNVLSKRAAKRKRSVRS
jgi:hypothetical protein